MPVHDIDTEITREYTSLHKDNGLLIYKLVNCMLDSGHWRFIHLDLICLGSVVCAFDNDVLKQIINE